MRYQKKKKKCAQGSIVSYNSDRVYNSIIKKCSKIVKKWQT